jgi:hypothetical protein
LDRDALIDHIKETWSSTFRRGSRYQVEKFSILGGYVVIVVGTLFWALSGPRDNELGAVFGRDKIQAIEREVYFLENTSRDPWTRVRVVMDKRYLHKRDSVDRLSRVTLSPQDFSYFYYIPRTWGVRDWELLAVAPKPDAVAPHSYVPELVQIRAYEGALDIKLSNGVQQSAEKGQRNMSTEAN